MVKMNSAISTCMVNIFKSIICQKAFAIKRRAFTIHTPATTNHYLMLNN